MSTVAPPAPSEAPPPPPAEPERPGWAGQLAGSLLVPLLALITALVLGAVVIVLSDPGQIDGIGDAFSTAYDAYFALVKSSLGSKAALGRTLRETTPLLFGGLSVAFAFRAGLFNIGAPGQLVMGAAGAGYVGFTYDLPAVIHLPFAIVAGFVAGALYGAIAGVLKARTGAHEVITTIMLNYVALRLLEYFLSTDAFHRPGRDDPISPQVLESARFPFISDSFPAHYGIFLALVAAGGVWFLLNRTTVGYRLRAVGANPHAARYAGMSVGATYFLAMAIAGGLAGLAGTSNVLGVPSYSLTPGYFFDIGFDAIAVALLGRANPIGVVGAAFLFGILRAGATGMQVATDTPVDIIVIIQALIIAFVAAPALIRAIWRVRADRVGRGQNFTTGVGRMTAVSATPRDMAPAPSERREVSPARALGFGVLFLVLGVVMVFAFGFGSNSGLSTNFVLDRDPEIDFSVSSRGVPLLLGVVTAAIGGLVIARVLRTRLYLFVGIALVLFVFSLLTWAGRDSGTSLLGLLQGAIIRSIPLALGALAGVLCERAGVINIAIEGMMLGAAFVGTIVASSVDNLWLGMAGGIAIGAALGWVLAVLSIRYTVDQIIGGTVINIFALGITSFLAAKVLQEYQDLNQPGTFRPIEIPLLSDIPFFGDLFFDNSVYVYLVFLLVGLVWWGLSRTRWGLRVRSVGEHPRAADTVGINVLRTRYRAVLLGGAMAGLAGTFFSLGSAGGFEEEMTAGKGFIALAALIFGRWHPVGALCAALVFGFAEELQARLALLNTPIPSEFLLMTPYLVTIVVVAGLVGRARAPAADGQPYKKQ